MKKFKARIEKISDWCSEHWTVIEFVNAFIVWALLFYCQEFSEHKIRNWLIFALWFIWCINFYLSGKSDGRKEMRENYDLTVASSKRIVELCEDLLKENAMLLDKVKELETDKAKELGQKLSNDESEAADEG